MSEEWALNYSAEIIHKQLISLIGFGRDYLLFKALLVFLSIELLSTICSQQDIEILNPSAPQSYLL